MCLHALGDRRENVLANFFTNVASLTAGPKMLPEAFYQLTEAGEPPQVIPGPVQLLASWRAMRVVPQSELAQFTAAYGLSQYVPRA